MEWIKENFFLCVVIAIISLVALFLVLSFIISTSISKRNCKKDILPRHYDFGCQINFSKNRVIYFEKRKFGEKKILSVDDFVRRFHNKDQQRVKNWFNNLSSGIDCDDYLETEVVTENIKCYYCLLKFKKNDSENNILYIELQVYQNMPSSQGRKKSVNKDYALIKKNQIESVYNSLKRKRGFVYAVNFFFNVQEVISSEEIEKSVLIKFKNEVYSFIKGKRYYRYFFDKYDNDIYVFDFKFKKQLEAESLANDMYEKLQEFIDVKGYSELCGVTIGIVKVTEKSSFNELLEDSFKAAESARTNSLPYVFANESDSDSLCGFKQEIIDQVFQKDSLKYFFRPILNISNEQVAGYFGTVKCLNSEFENYFEMARYVNKVDRNKELLSNVLEYFVSKFYSEKPKDDARLFLQTSLVDLDHLCKVLTNISHAEDINLVLLFEETEVNANAFSLDLLHSQFNELKTLGYDIALLLKDENTLLESDFYENFNYFVVGSSMVSRIKESNRYRLSNKYLIESLLQYKRPIIIDDLDGWASIDLFIKSGCSLLSADAISPSNEMILPVEKSKIARIRKLK